DDNRGGGFNRDRGDRGFERRDDNRGGGFNRDHRGGSDRPFNRDRRDDRPSGGFRSGGGDRPYGRRDDHRPSGSGSFGGRRDDKPRWKRNG
ncbi:RNA helicase, partial [Streptomyces sp. NPDC090022]